MSPTVWFAHGLDGVPWGRKITALAAVARDRGLDVASPDYSFTRDPDERVRHLLAQRPPTGKGLILVGSSMGGYVSAVAGESLRPAAMFLMAPALHMPGYQAEPVPTAGRLEVVHGWNDEVIPVEHAWRFAARWRAALHVLDADHALTEALPELEALFGRFLDAVLGAPGGDGSSVDQ